MTAVPHPHECLCGRRWHCGNAHCAAGELTPCRTPACTRTEALRHLAWLEDQMDVAAQYQAQLREYDQPELATAMSTFRSEVLRQVMGLSRRLQEGG